ncbi:hypothetical protein HOLleu_43803 [Holothuria leucospilota]|uniref:TTF-type domain-containing protein n=1 Tax=Holothuria leucospilota TaxID=206669 RepID=A0A9Q0YGK4_HOLLE|nr:hypothetical protein HOLleu_43803 [Holothuria leucospilota]
MSRKITAFFKRVEPDTSDKTESLQSEGAGIGNQESDSAPDHDVADLEDLEVSSTSSESMAMSDRNTRPAVGPSTSTSSSGTATASRPRKHVPLKKDKRRDRMRTFPHKWLKQFQWLRYNKADNAMYCQCCRARQVSGVWCTGTRNFRLKTIKAHLSSSEHQTSVSAQASDQRQIHESAKRAAAAKKRAFTLALKSAYWIATEELANAKYKSLIQLLQHLGLDDAKVLNKGGNANYTSPTIFNQLLDSLSESVKERIITEIGESPFVGIGVDESTDRAREKHVGIVIRYINDGEVVTTFLSCEKVADGCAQTIFATVKEAMCKFKIPMAKVIGLGSDGASVMASHINGLNGFFHEDNPFIVFVHCVCHRLQLAVSQASKEVHEMNAFVKIIGAVYNYVQSETKLRAFKDIAEVLDQETLKFKRLYEIRWLSLGNAVAALVRNYEALMVLASSDANDGDPTAIGILQQLSSYKYAALLHLACDILTETNHLSKVLQHRDVSFGVVGNQIRGCIETLQDMKDQDGLHLQDFHSKLDEGTGSFKGVDIKFTTRERGNRESDEKVNFQTVICKLLDELVKNLRERFPNVSLFDAMEVFQPSAYPDSDHPALLIGWGNQNMRTLLSHFGSAMSNKAGQEFSSPIDSESCLGEFLPFKRLVAQNLGESKSSDCSGTGTFHFFTPAELFCRLFSGQNRDNRILFPEIFRLFSACLCILVGNAEAERVFSCQNRIKTAMRSCLSVECLDKLIRLSFAGIPIENFPFEAALDRFMGPNRRL